MKTTLERLQGLIKNGLMLTVTPANRPVLKVKRGSHATIIVYKADGSIKSKEPECALGKTDVICIASRKGDKYLIQVENFKRGKGAKRHIEGLQLNWVAAFDGKRWLPEGIDSMQKR